MPASQHQNPKSDIEIAQSAKKRPILDIAREKLGITADHLEPYGHYKAKIGMDFVKDALANKPDGKLIIVEYYKRAGAMGGGNSALTHIRLDDADVIKEVEAAGFSLIEEREHIPKSQYIALFHLK